MYFKCVKVELLCSPGARTCGSGPFFTSPETPVCFIIYHWLQFDPLTQPQEGLGTPMLLLLL